MGFDHRLSELSTNPLLTRYHDTKKEKETRKRDWIKSLISQQQILGIKGDFLLSFIPLFAVITVSIVSRAIGKRNL